MRMWELAEYQSSYVVMYLCVAPPSLQPFVDATHPAQLYFPERRWAIVIPTVAFVGAVTVAGTVVGLVMIRAAWTRKSR